MVKWFLPYFTFLPTIAGPKLLKFKYISEDLPLCACSSLALVAYYVFVKHIYSGTKSGYGLFELHNERLNQVEILSSTCHF